MKRKAITGSIVLLLYALVLTACCTPGTTESLTVTLHPQETSNWCWAASGQMVMHYLGNNVSQCTQANNRFGRTDCCSIDLCPPPTESKTHPCVTGGWPEFGKYGFTFSTTTNAPLSWKDLKEEISTNTYCGKRPFAFTWAWIGGGGHMMVARGYETINGVKYVRMLDPWAPCVGDAQLITYAYYDEAPGHHTHWNDYYNVR